MTIGKPIWHLIKPGSETVNNPDPDSFRPQNQRSRTQNPKQTRPQPPVERGWADKVLHRTHRRSGTGRPARAEDDGPGDHSPNQPVPDTLFTGTGRTSGRESRDSGRIQLPKEAFVLVRLSALTHCCIFRLSRWRHFQYPACRRNQRLPAGSGGFRPRSPFTSESQKKPHATKWLRSRAFSSSAGQIAHRNGLNDIQPIPELLISSRRICSASEIVHGPHADRSR